MYAGRADVMLLFLQTGLEYFLSLEALFPTPEDAALFRSSCLPRRGNTAWTCPRERFRWTSTV